MWWRPFELNPSLPSGRGYNKLQYYNEKFGAERVAQMVPHMKRVGERVGISFSYGGFVGNTFNSHRLIWRAREDGGSALQDKVVESVFRAYFEEEKSLGEASVLRDCAERAGMDTASTVLDDESAGTGEVRNEMTEFRAKTGCRGVPLFVIDETHVLNGAQPPEAFLEVFGRLR